MAATTEILNDPDSGGFVVVRTERFDGLLDHLAERRAIKDYGPKDTPCLMELPALIIEQYCKEAGITWADWWADNTHLKRMANDPALSAFRVKPGKV